MGRNELIQSFADTMRRVYEDSLYAETMRAAADTRVYREDFCAPETHGSWAGEISVVGATSFAAAGSCRGEGRIAVLNFANPRNPGGGVTGGAMAQEECLCRCSNLYPCLNQVSVFADYYGYHREWTNPFFSDRLVYSPGVTVFKDEELNPLDPADWFRVDIITCAAPCLRARRYTNRKALLELFKGRVRNIFEAAIDNRVEILILGAFGCGAFRNPPDIVAKAFHEVIAENNYKTLFKRIIFAIKSAAGDDPNAPDRNRMAFEQEFSGISGKAKQPVCETENKRVPVSILPQGVLSDNEARCRYNSWRSRNRYFGKQFSILGDSISTLAGYNPSGYRYYYLREDVKQADIRQMEDTWWGQVIDFFGGELLVNNSWSGSRVTRLPDNEEEFPSGCSEERTAGLHINGVMPDVILVYMGTNDWLNGVAISDDDLIWESLPLTFDFAYWNMLNRIRSRYPEAEIWCCTLSTARISSDPGYVFEERGSGERITAFNEIIRKCAADMNCGVIDLYANQLPYDTLDGIHPNADGMRTLAAQIAMTMGGTDCGEYLECPCSVHAAAPAAASSGKTEYLSGKSAPAAFAGGPDETDGATRQLCTACLLLRDRNGEMLRFDQESVVVGRDSGCDLVINSDVVSRYHARFVHRRGTWYLEDLASMNGVCVNDVRLDTCGERALNGDDRIVFAEDENRFVFCGGTER